MSWRLMAVLAMVCLLAGCSHLKNLVKGDPEIIVIPADRKPEIHGYLNKASEVTGIKLENNDLLWELVPATHYVDGKAAIKELNWPGHTARNVGSYVWLDASEDLIKCKSATCPDGRLGPRTGLHEAARILFTDAGWTKEKYEPEMKRLGLW